ncbi:MAG: AAA family ATPase [candidate division Zixibacteria bacterium]|nr:AAA family ATPase [candidate division Zixibacteria bacterium]
MILYGEDFGLLVLEVKDWEVWQIRYGDPHFFTVHFSGEDKSQKNPEKQAKDYADRLMGVLRNIPSLRERDGKYRGKLKIPVGRAVVFTNISLEDYTRYKLQYLIPLENVLLKDDLDPAGEILCDPSGQKFRKRIEPMFPFPFQGFNNSELDLVKDVLWPEVWIDLPVRKGAGKTRFQTEVMRLDELQARLALKLKHGHQIVKGPPGSGKTLVLIKRCSQLKKREPSAQRVLFVCYNIVLVSYLKRLLMENGVGVGDDVEVRHFFDLCSKILDDKGIKYSGEGPEYFQFYIDLALETVEAGSSRLESFDAIFVDEAQDFDEKMIKVVMGLLKPKGDLLIAQDTYQDIYRRRSSWKELGIQAKGRSRYLRNVYRSTREIFEFTQQFIGENVDADSQKARFPFESALRGPEPELKPFSNYEELVRFVIDDISNEIKQGEFKRAEIAVIYDDKIYSPEGIQYASSDVPKRLVAGLEAKGIPANWVSEDVRAKEEFDITTDQVSVISIHSSKGLDYDLVYLVGVDRHEVEDVNRDQLIKTVYVAMTRAKYRLVIPYVAENDLTTRMKQCLKPK